MALIHFPTPASSGSGYEGMLSVPRLRNTPNGELKIMKLGEISNGNTDKRKAETRVLGGNARGER